ncbi:MAG TPA: VIT domain-containing protein [Candidatus Obscuribacterales bacterium]
MGLSLQSESIKVDINDQVAKTYICQTFYNNTDRNLAGTYLFPLPEDTTFSSFSLHIDGKPVEGKILEANEARQQYEEIVRRMVDPGLLEYADYKTVRARIFPIPAHGTKKVELEYTQVLRVENGMLKYRFPLKSENQSEAVDEIKVDVKLGSSQGLRTIWSPSHSISANRSDDHHAKISLLEKNTVPDKDFVLYYSVSDKELAANLLTHKNEGEYGYFLLTLTPPVQTKQIIGKDIVLVADTSGSMQGEKMEQCKKALKYVVNALNASDRFNVVEFNTDVEKFRSGLVAATPENKKAALAFINELEARGGTNIGDALRTGKTLLSQPSERPAYLVFMTDGEPTVGETDVSRILKTAANTRNIRIFDFGVGYDVNTKLLNKLAEQNHGTSQYVEPDEDLETALSNFYQKIKSPVLSDVNIAYEGIQVKDVYPREVKDIFAGSQALLIGKYKGAGKAVVRLTGKVNGVARAYSFPLSFASEETGHTYLPRLWAMRRIGYLTEVAQENGNNREVVDEIIALSKKYGIISAYTSFLVTDPSENRRLADGRPMPLPAQVTGFGGVAGGVAPMSAAAPEAFMSTGAATGALKGSGGGVAMGRAGLHAGPRISRSAAALPPTRLQSFVADSGFAGAIYGDEGARSESIALGLASAAPAGKSAVARSKAVREFQWTTVAADKEAKKDAGIKAVEDKTFYLREGFWTDSSFDGKSGKPEIISFGSQQYFDLMRKVPGISKYLAVGRQVILVYKGHVYKIVDSKTATG